MSDGLITMLDGSLESLQPGERGLILGVELTLDLQAQIGDALVLLIPRPVGDGTLQPVLETFYLRGVFEAGIPEHDRSLGLAHIDDVATIRALGDAVETVRFPSRRRCHCAERRGGASDATWQ